MGNPVPLDQWPEYHRMSRFGVPPNPADSLDMISERFWKKVEKTAGCWRWMGAKNDCGYGKLGVFLTEIYAHRMAMYLTGTVIPPGLFACHKCDNPSCVNPGHIFIGSNTDNMLDCAKKGRMRRAVGEKVPRARFTSEQIMGIRSAYKRNLFGYLKIAKIFGVSSGCIRGIIQRKTWKHI